LRRGRCFSEIDAYNRSLAEAVDVDGIRAGFAELFLRPLV
jgi:hypothetical protein